MWVTAAYVLRAGDVARRHVETASFLFGAVLLAGAFMRRASENICSERIGASARIPAAARGAVSERRIRTLTHGSWLSSATDLDLERLRRRRPAVLVFPGNVEAVTWVSGVFDLVLAACVLSAVMIALEPGMPAPFAIAAMTVIAIAALAAKETGVVLPLIVLVSVYARWGVRRALTCAPAMAALLCVAIYIAVRLWRGLDVA